ncbi:Uncharacterised protein [Legionella pneumophila]|nr:Uncharacterised protein [Legionella pneumophila]CZH41152.1 Uncharacterised protein [Legionella pneumophila]
MKQNWLYRINNKTANKKSALETIYEQIDILTMLRSNHTALLINSYLLLRQMRLRGT